MKENEQPQQTILQHYIQNKVTLNFIIMIQITKCPCGKTFAACREPECYSDADYQKETRNYIKKGCTVEMVESGTWNFEKCTCPNMKPENKAQLSINL